MSRGHHADLPKTRRQKVGDILKAAAAVRPKGASGRQGVLAGKDPAADEKAKAAASVEIGRRHGARRSHAAREGGPAVPVGIAMAVIQVKPRLIFGRDPTAGCCRPL